MKSRRVKTRINSTEYWFFDRKINFTYFKTLLSYWISGSWKILSINL